MLSSYDMHLTKNRGNRTPLGRIVNDLCFSPDSWKSSISSWTWNIILTRLSAAKSKTSKPSKLIHLFVRWRMRGFVSLLCFVPVYSTYHARFSHTCSVCYRRWAARGRKFSPIHGQTFEWIERFFKCVVKPNQSSYSNQSTQGEKTKGTNQKSKQIEVTSVKRGKTRTSKSPLTNQRA